MFDRLEGQTPLVKYLLDYEHPSGVPLAAGEPALGELTETVIAEAARDFFGLRRIAVNRVRAESVDEPGQRPTEQVLTQTLKRALVELWFDHCDGPRSGSRGPAVRAGLRGVVWAGAWLPSRGGCGLDPR